MQSITLIFFGALVLLNIAFIVWFSITSFIEKRRMKKLIDRKKAYEQVLEAKAKAKELKRLQKEEQRKIRMARLEVVSEESDHSWKIRKQSKATIRILEKRLGEGHIQQKAPKKSSKDKSRDILEIPRDIHDASSFFSQSSQ